MDSGIVTYGATNLDDWTGSGERVFKPTELIRVGGWRVSYQEISNVYQALTSHWLSYGKWHKQFEIEFAAAHDVNHAVFCNSGTSALEMGLMALKEKYQWKDGDKVLVPAITFVASVNMILRCGLTPVLVDVRKDDYCIDLEKVHPIRENTVAIMPVHVFGQPCMMHDIMSVAHMFNLKVIEDSCECMFAKCDTKSVGSFGDVSAFSTYVSHFLFTGAGGLGCTSDPELAEIMRSYMNHGRDMTEPGFKFERMGHSFRSTELEAALGCAQLKTWPDIINRRRKIAHFYKSELDNLQGEIQLPAEHARRDHNFMMFPIVMREQPKDEIVKFLASRLIETRDMLPITNQPIYRHRFGYSLEDMYPVAKWINRNGFYVGCHPYMNDNEVQWVADSIRSFFSK